MTLKQSYKFDGTTPQELRDALIKLFEEHRELVPRKQSTRVNQAESNGQLRTYEFVLDVLHGLEFTS